MSAHSYTVVASTNLLDWQAIGLPPHIGGSAYEFIDPDATTRSARFYRLRWP